MIRSIPIIKNFGVFANFAWPAGLPDFKRFNLIYGWNYSGKTTLSRVFRCFALRSPHADFPGAEAQLRREDGTICNLAAPEAAPILRVFNSDFVRDNLGFEEGDAEPILVLGAEDKAKVESLRAKRAEREALAKKKETDDAARRRIDGEIKKALQSYARDMIKNPLSIPGYDVRRFTPVVERCKSAPQDYLLDDEAISRHIGVYRSTERREVLQMLATAAQSCDVVRKKVGDMVSRVVAANKPIERLKDRTDIERWVAEGRALHSEKDVCQFCGQKLPGELLSELAGHFSADYERLMDELKAVLAIIDKMQKEDIGVPPESAFYPEYVGRVAEGQKHLTNAMVCRKAALDILAETVREKQTQAFAKLACPGIQDPTVLLKEAMEEINAVIREHNARTTEFEGKRRESLRLLEEHFAASFVIKETYSEKTQQLIEYASAVVRDEAGLKTFDAEIRTLEEAISEASKGAEQINRVLQAYFGKKDLQVVVSEDKRFRIHRGGVLAKNLSEGEKTALAFAYFITRIQDGQHPLGNIRVVIDDPISSLDSQHLFNTYAIIKTTLVECRQLFIATHSFEFYNLIRDWVAEDEKVNTPQVNWKKWSVYLLKKTDDGRAVVTEVPRELLKFKSEYHYLFSVLHGFEAAGNDGFDCLWSLPNVTRRFMEAFGGIMIPLSMGLKGKMQRLFPDEVERERVWKFINQYSHNTTITRSLTIPDTSECRAVVHSCLEAVRRWRKDYYDDLTSEMRA